MKKIITLFALFIITYHVQAQLPPKTDGTQYVVKDLDGINGSVFLYDDWQKGEVTLQDGHTYKDLDLKYDAYKDKVYYKNDDGATLIFIVPVKSFIISSPEGEPVNFDSGYTHVPDYSETSFFVPLNKGKVQVIKKVYKTIDERLEFPVTTPIKSFAAAEKYYLVTPDKIVPLKKDKKSLLAALGNKQAEVEKYIKQNNLNVKEDADLGKVLEYYNTI